MFTLRHRLSALALAAALLAPRPAGAMVRQPTFSDSIPEAAHLSAALTPACPELAEEALPHAPEYLAFLVETPEGFCWIICRNDPVDNSDPTGLEYVPVLKYDEHDRLIGLDYMQYVAPAGTPGTGYSLHWFDTFKQLGMMEYDEFDRRFENVLRGASSQYRFGDLSEWELREAIARGYVGEWDYPLLAYRQESGDWAVAMSGGEVLEGTAWQIGLAGLAEGLAAILKQFRTSIPANLISERPANIERRSFSVGRGDMDLPGPGYERHHGVNSVWMKARYSTYNPKQAPVVAMPTKPSHNATRGLFMRFKGELARRQGVGFNQVDWKKVSPGEAWRLAEEEFEAAHVPNELREEYFRSFNEYAQGITK